MTMLFCPGENNKSSAFMGRIRNYNGALAFASIVAAQDLKIRAGGGPPVYRISGQMYHFLGGILSFHLLNVLMEF